MTGIIIKPTRREAEASRQENLHRRGLDPQRYRGTARTTEEAHDVQRGLERDGEKFDKLWEVFGPDAKQANEDMDLRSGIDPESNGTRKLRG